MGLEHLAPSQRFMYEYGCFVSFWSNFELLMEVAICDLTGATPRDNCHKINTKTAGVKRDELKRLLSARGQTAAEHALQEVFDVSDRNGWVHGHILNPRGDFSLLTRLRIEHQGTTLSVTNAPVSFDLSPFSSFYRAYGEFQRAIGVTNERCNRYILDLQSA